MLVKAGVDISRLSPEIRPYLRWAQIVLNKFGDEIVITSTYEGNHREDSYHYGNDSFDFTGRYSLKRQTADDLQDRAAGWVDVVFEQDHIHVEFDRRKYNKQEGIT